MTRPVQSMTTSSLHSYPEFVPVLRVVFSDFVSHNFVHLQAGVYVVALVAAMHAIAFVAGYWIPCALGCPKEICRASAIQVSHSVLPTQCYPRNTLPARVMNAAH